MFTTRNGKVLNHGDGIGEVGRVRVVGHKQVPEDSFICARHLVEGGFLPPNLGLAEADRGVLPGLFHRPQLVAVPRSASASLN